MPKTSLSKAYNYRLWIVYLNSRYNISYPFRHLLCFKMTVVWCIWRKLFLKEVYLSFCLKNVTFFEKKYFFFACNTHFSSIFTLIAHYFNPRLQTMYWNVSRSLPYLFFKNGNINKNTEYWKFDSNSVYCCSIFRPKCPVILQFYKCFIYIYSF